MNAMNNKTDYTIPKLQVQVDMLIDEGKPPEIEVYVLFLDEFSQFRTGPETLDEFLNKKKELEFIPVKNFNSDEFFILNLKDIVFVREKEKSTTQALQKVTLFLRNNIKLEVDHSNPFPETQARARVLDYLNQEGQFVLFYHEYQKLFVNKNKIIKVRER